MEGVTICRLNVNTEKPAEEELGECMGMSTPLAWRAIV